MINLWEVARLREGSMNDSGLSHRLGVAPHDAPLAAALGRRSIVLVGMMGAGKSSIRPRLPAPLPPPRSPAPPPVAAAPPPSLPPLLPPPRHTPFPPRATPPAPP